QPLPGVLEPRSHAPAGAGPVRGPTDQAPGPGVGRRSWHRLVGGRLRRSPRYRVQRAEAVLMSSATAQNLPPGVESWCRTLRGEQAWRMQSPGGESAMTTWRALRDRHGRTGLWPVILGSDPQVVDQL